MKLLVAAVLLSVALADVSFNDMSTQYGFAHLGYPNRVSVPKAGSVSLWGTFNADTRILPNLVPADQDAVCVLIQWQMTSVNADTTSKWYVNTASSLATATNPATSPLTSRYLANLDQTKGLTSAYDIFDWTPTNGTTTYAWPYGFSVGATTTPCSTCVSTTDYQVTALIGVDASLFPGQCQKSSSPTWGPSLTIDNANTFAFPASGGSGGSYQTQPQYFLIDNNLANANNIFVMTTPATGDAMSIVGLVQPLPMTASTSGSNYHGYPLISNWPNPPSGIQTQNFNVGPWSGPLGSPFTGTYNTGSTPLAAPGTNNGWYLAPYVNTKGSSTNHNWQIAVGYGHQPSAASGLAPSMLLAAVIAMLALFL